MAAPAAANGESDGSGDSDFATPRVMTLNLYIGADFTSLDPSIILPTILQTNFRERAKSIAAGIDRRNPDLIGLQEVSDLSVTFGPFGNTPVPGFEDAQLDYLEILLKELADRGEHYVVASDVMNAKVSLPIAEGVFGNVIDRDVILARAGTKTSHPQGKNYSDNFTIPGVGIELTRGWTSVDAEVRGAHFTFVNTHLEVEPDPNPDPLTGGGTGYCPVGTEVPCQLLQAQELTKILSGMEQPTILVGDFNAEPGTAAYRTIAAAGFIDAWDVRFFNVNQQSKTCCQAENLLNPVSLLSQRIDIIFVRVDGRVRSLATVVFDRPWEKTTPTGLWPSDHGGVVALVSYRKP